MANSNRGEISADIDGKKIVFKLTMNSICELEQVSGKPIGALLQDIEAYEANPAKASISDLRLLVWSALLDGMPDCTISDAGDIMTSLGIKKSMELLGSCVGASFPQGEADKQGKS